jgi:hypothetical protein
MYDLTGTVTAYCKEQQSRRSAWRGDGRNSVLKKPHMRHGNITAAEKHITPSQEAPAGTPAPSSGQGRDGQYRSGPRYVLVLGLSLVSGVTAMSTSDHWLIQRHSNFHINENIHVLMQPWLGRVVGGLGARGVEVQ